MPKSTSEITDDFWSFSLDVYGRPGVAQALLELQDRAGLDVNCLLFCCWTGMAGYGCLTLSEMSAVLKVSEGWNARIVSPLRAVRRALKEDEEKPDPAKALRRAVKDLEMEAERIEQTLLADVLEHEPQTTGSNKAARANCEAYLKAKACPLPPSLQSAMKHVLESLSVA